ncbi:hypothetical protein PV08_00181 [Exophiala spinifera]|uniref:F-box domain-containing protein n=1 Tax=Exophiala spinifera TaxID=91928 RepID=A0A0D2BKY3_9EURO|nr:uncharacterized protein PV08_00181 [Exophiala spinifera]KIW19608.1 hypothetical protein PV08_00181 [Exophiala spinifera]
MPKKKKGTKSARAEPYKATVPARRRSERIAQAVPEDTQTATEGLASPGLLLTGLPLEIRLEIFGYFTGAPTEYDEQERQKIELTRRSLLLVSRQVNTEWTPLFFNTTTIMFKAGRTDRAGFPTPSKATRQEENELHAMRIAVNVSDELLKSISLPKLEFVKKLHWEHTIAQARLGWHGGGVGQIADDRGLVRLSHALKHMKASLPNLTEVIYSNSTGYHTESFSATNDPSGKEHDHEHEFRRIDAGGRHQELANRLVGERRSSVLRGFVVDKKVIFEPGRYLGTQHLLYAQGFQIIFKKARGANSNSNVG